MVKRHNMLQCYSCEHAQVPWLKCNDPTRTVFHSIGTLTCAASPNSPSPSLVRAGRFSLGPDGGVKEPRRCTSACDGGSLIDVTWGSPHGSVPLRGHFGL